MISGLSADSIVVKAVTADGYGHAAEGQGAIRAPLNAIQLVGTASAGGAKPPTLSKLVANAGGFSFLIKDVDGAAADPIAFAADGGEQIKDFSNLEDGIFSSNTKLISTILK